MYLGIRWNARLGIYDFKVQGDGEFAQNRQHAYKKMCEGMVEEITTRYGDLFMIWFDGGASDPRTYGADVLPIVQKNVIDMLDRRELHFYIRMLNFKGIRQMFVDIKDWQDVDINYHRRSVASIDYFFDQKGKTYRVVVTRTLKKDDPFLDLFEEKAYHHQAIITNNREMSEKEIIEFYNKRGIPKSLTAICSMILVSNIFLMDMDTNTVYMYLMGLCVTLFEWIKQVLVKNKAMGICRSMRVKNIFFQYISVASNWISHARKNILKIYSSQAFEVLTI